MYGLNEDDIRLIRNLLIVVAVIIGAACFGLGAWLF